MTGYMERFVDQIKGRLVLLYGQPMAGKSTLAKALAGHFKKAFYIVADENWETAPKGAIVKKITEPQQLFGVIRALEQAEEKDALVVVDSLTTLFSDFISSKLNSPRRNLELRNFTDTVLRKLSKLKAKGYTVLVIAHEALKDFNGKVGPAMNLIGLRHIDQVYRVYIRDNGARGVKKEMAREEVQEPKFYWEGV